MTIKRTLQKGLLVGAIIISVGLLIYMLVETVLAKRTGFEAKTLWDWMELLIIPLVLAGGAYYLNRSERTAERRIALDRQRETALQNYLEGMGELLFEKGLLTSENATARNIAKIQTLSVLRELDPNRKRVVLLFLKESKLIASNPLVNLSGADLSRVDLSRIDLSRTKLKESDLSGATLIEADLREVDLSGANLSGANLRGADLRVANLSRANLSRANLSRTKLHDATLERANLRGADLKGAVLRSSNMSGIDLSGIKLNGVDLSEVIRKEANLWGANDTLEKDFLLATGSALIAGTTPDRTKPG